MTWVARYIDPDRRERSRSFSRKVDAQRFAEDQGSKQRSNEWIDPDKGNIMLKDFWRDQRGRPGVRGLPAPSTLAKWDSVWARHLQPLENRALASITRQDVKDAIGQINSPWQGAEALKLLRMLLNRAIDDNRIKSNPAARVREPRTTRTKIRILKPEEVAAVARALPERWRAFVILAAYSSLRWSELVAVKRENIDLRARTVRVDEKVTEVNGQFQWGEPKTPVSTRVVDLPTAVVGPLAEHLLHFPPLLNAEDPRCVGLVFYGETEEPVRRKTFRRIWLKALQTAGIEDHVRVEWLRHSGASLAYAASRDMVAVARRLGHTSTRMVDAKYVELYSEVSRHVADAMDRFIEAGSVAVTGQRRDHDGTDGLGPVGTGGE
jgi:integrase